MSASTPRSRLQRMIGGYWITQAVCAAAELGIADLLDEEPRSAHELAEAAGADAFALSRLLRTLASLGVFREDEQGRFSHTELSALLRADAPGSLKAAALTVSELHYRAFGELAHSLRTGQPGFDKAHGVPFFEYLAADPRAAEHFDGALAELRARANSALLDAYDFSGIGTLIDVGGGAGTLMAAVLAKYPSMRGVLFDLPHVAAAADETLKADGVRERCQFVAGNFFESVPPGGDVYLLRHILHDWDDERSGAVLKNCRRAITQHSRMLVVESVIGAGNAPSIGKCMDLQMLALTGGRERTEAEFAKLLQSAGFQIDRVIPLFDDLCAIEVVVR